MPGSVIESHAGLTIIYGENCTGKTGYARTLKALTKSRTDGDVLGDVSVEATSTPTATIAFTIGDEQKELQWAGEHGIVPFTRMSIFDTPSVTYQVDADLEYVYVPAALALFNDASGRLVAFRAGSKTGSRRSSLVHTCYSSAFPARVVGLCPDRDARSFD